MGTRCARFSGLLLLLTALLSCAGTRRAETGVSIPPPAQVQAPPEPAARLATPQPGKLLPDGQDLRLDLLDPVSFSGGGHSVVIVDPSNRQNLKGFVRLPGDTLADLVSKYTGLEVETGGNDHIDPMDLPIGGSGFGTSQTAVQDLVEYLRRGGFLLGVGEAPPDVRQALLKYAGLVSGIDYHSELLSPDHPIFHAYFDLPFESPGSNGDLIRAQGFFLGERLVGVSEMPGGERGTINAVVFALTQPGGIAKRYLRP